MPEISSFRYRTGCAARRNQKYLFLHNVYENSLLDRLFGIFQRAAIGEIKCYEPACADVVANASSNMILKGYSLKAKNVPKY